ncbi:MAG: hypothetical protein AAGH90_09765 [Pseudomonadota bacterium]
MNQILFYIFTGLIALIILGVFIRAVRISYRIQRLENGPPTVPKFANVFGHTLGLGVPKTPEGQALHRRLLVHLGYVLVGFAFLAVIILVMR